MLQIESAIRVSETAAGTDANRDSLFLSLSADGKTAIFQSRATNLVEGDTNNTTDIFLKDLATGAVQRVNVNANGEESGFFQLALNPAYDADAGLVYFLSAADNLIAGQSNVSGLDFYAKNLVTGAVELVSVNEAGDPLNENINSYALSPDGQSLVFTTSATNALGTVTPAGNHTYLKNLQTGEITQLNLGADDSPASSSYSGVRFSADGSTITFQSNATNLTSETLSGTHIYTQNLVTGDITHISADDEGVAADNTSNTPAISADGSKILYTSLATNLVDGDVNGKRDVFLKDLTTGDVTLVSTTETGAQGDADVGFAIALSPDGTKAVFTSASSVLGENALSFVQNILIKDLVTGELTQLVSPIDGAPLDSSTNQLAFNDDGSQLLITTNASNLIADDTNSRQDVYILNLVDYDDNLLGEIGNDTLSGGRGDDTINGFKGDDLILGEDDNDSLIGWTGDDTIFGGDGDDSALGGSGNDSLVGGAGEDYLSAFRGNDVLEGGDGVDTLRGGDGDDTLDGGLGRDVLRGDDGADVFRFTNVTESHRNNSDRIIDFEAGVDKIDVSAFAFTGFYDGGPLEAGEVRLAYSAASDRTYIRENDSTFDVALQGDYRGLITADDFIF